MNKKEFLHILEISLSDFKDEERKEILYDYEEHFRIGEESGKSEEELIKELGDPNNIANQYRTSDKQERNEVPKDKKKFNIKKIVIYLLGIMLVSFGLGKMIMIGTGTNPVSGIIKTGQLTNHTKTTTNNSINDTKSDANNSIDDTKTSSLDGINEINVNAYSATINIIPEGTSNVKVHFYGDVTSNNSYTKPEIQCTKSGNSLVIKEVNETNTTSGFLNSNIKLDVYIPSDYNKDVELTCSSGDINVNEYKFNKLDCNISSGDLNMNNINANTFNYSNSSGNLKADKLTTNTTSLISSSGSININNFSGDLKLGSSSGDTNIEYGDFHNSIDMHSSSGQLVLTLPISAEFNLDASASSGDVTCEFPITISGKNDDHKIQGVVVNGKNKINLDASSGDIKILH